MRAAVLTGVDGAFELRDVPDPVGGEKVLVRVRAAGVNFADVLVRRGRDPPMPQLPAGLGSGIAGGLEGGGRAMGVSSGGGGCTRGAPGARAHGVPRPPRASLFPGA